VNCKKISGFSGSVFIFAPKLSTWFRTLTVFEVLEFLKGSLFHGHLALKNLLSTFFKKGDLFNLFLKDLRTSPSWKLIRVKLTYFINSLSV